MTANQDDMAEIVEAGNFFSWVTRKIDLHRQEQAHRLTIIADTPALGRSSEGFDRLKCCKCSRIRFRASATVVGSSWEPRISDSVAFLD